jgi:hypothetical protein
LRGRPPLREVSLTDADVQRLLSLFHRNGKLDRMFGRYLDAKAALKERGASIGLKDTLRAQRVCARLEVSTKNPSIDERVYSLVKGMGFDLTLKSMPTKEGDKRTYVITESSSHDVSRIVGMAESLVRLSDMLSSPEFQEVLAKGPAPPYVRPEERGPQRRADVVRLRMAS